MTKTISLADDAYEALKAVRRGGESFSDVARRLARDEALAALWDPTIPAVLSHKEAGELRRRTSKAREESRTPRYTP